MFKSNDRQVNTGLLIMRMAIAMMTLWVVVPRLKSGAAAGSTFAADLPLVGSIGPSATVGLILLVILAAGAASLASGYFFRLSCLLYCLVYGIFTLDYMASGYQTLPLYSGTLCLVCLGLVLTGPGKFSISVKIEKK